METDPLTLCTAVEPVTKRVMCQRERGHGLAHRGELWDETGKTTVEWYDARHIRAVLRQGIANRMQGEGR